MLSLKLRSQASQSAFSSFSTVDSCQQAALCKFYEDFLRQDLFQSVEISSTVIKDTGQTKSSQPYAVKSESIQAYVITVTTKLIDYTIEKRYSCFRQLYKKLAQRTNLQCQFPPKTLLSSSGSNQEVMLMRRELLQKFLQQLTQLPKQLLIELFEFLNLRGIYIKEKILLEDLHDKEFSIKCGQQNIFELMAKLEIEPTEALNQIQRIIFDGHARLSSETIRQLFAGLGNRKGLLQIALVQDSKETEDLVRFMALKLANRLLSFEENRDAQMYRRAFSACPLKIFKIARIPQSSQSRVNLFRLLRIYLRTTHEYHQNPLDIVFANDNQLQEDFTCWCKFQSDYHISS